MMNTGFTRETALAALMQYNKEPFHIQHALTVEKAMGRFANDLGHGEDAGFWAMVGLLHDIDFEMWRRALQEVRGAAGGHRRDA